LRNLRRDLPDGFFGRCVQVESRAEIVSLAEGMDGLEADDRRVATHGLV